jgi:hypothetical protein
MSYRRCRLLLAVFVVTMAVPDPCDGWMFFSSLRHETTGTGGAGVAFAQDSLAAGNSNQAQLGANNGPGFGWNDITVENAGIAYKVRPTLTVRGVYNHSGLPALTALDE